MQKLGLIFTSAAPENEEKHDTKISPRELSLILAKQKALEIHALHPNDFIIGSDQTAEITSTRSLLTNPGSISKALQQLQDCSGQTVCFYSAVSILGPSVDLTWEITTEVVFRSLTTAEIQRYVKFDNPVDCAGGFKIESLGISLFEKITSEDPTALVGLPLLSLANNLRKLGHLVP